MPSACECICRYEVILTGISEDDVGDGFEALVQIRLDRDVDLSIPRLFNPNSNHSDENSSNDRNETRNRHVANFMQSPGHCEGETNEKGYYSEDD